MGSGLGSLPVRRVGIEIIAAMSLAAVPPGWYLMQSGKRIPVMPQDRDQPAEAVEKVLIQWLDSHVFA